MALRDPNWEMEASIEQAKPDAYIGSVECLKEMSEERSSEERLGIRSSTTVISVFTSTKFANFELRSFL
jgi:hypothetical protein